jgi:hypothetical protein
VIFARLGYSIRVYIESQMAIQIDTEQFQFRRYRQQEASNVNDGRHRNGPAQLKRNAHYYDFGLFAFSLMFFKNHMAYCRRATGEPSKMKVHVGRIRDDV